MVFFIIRVSLVCFDGSRPGAGTDSRKVSDYPAKKNIRQTDILLGTSIRTIPPDRKGFFRCGAGAAWRISDRQRS